MEHQERTEEARPRQRTHRVLILRALMAAAAVLLGYVLVEFTWNANAFTMAPSYLLANLLFLAIIFSIIFLVGQRSRAAVVVFLATCLAMGIADYCLVSFKGQPVVPADLFALQTAAEVSAGYSFTPSWQVIVSCLLFVAACIALRFIPKRTLAIRGVLASTLAGALLAGGFCWYMLEGDIADDFDCIVGEWSTLWYYENQGTTLCFLKRVQDFFPDAPEGYSATRVDEALAAHAEDTEENEASVDGGRNSGAQASTQLAQEALSQGGLPDQMPNVIIVMNETFSDLSTYESITGDAAYPARFHAIAQDALASGTAYASCFGAGTCNSEFEVLTGSSMGNMGEDVYPYVLYDLAGNENLTGYFKTLGYDTTAIHPAEAQNWRRDRVYAQLGFDTFLSISDFPDAEKLRWFVTDRATYDKALEVIDSSDTPQFILEVTMQNHGGYDSGLIPEDDFQRVTVGGTEYASVNEFVSLMQRSDADLAYLVSELQKRDEPTVLLFFGDHQPSLSEVPEEELYGTLLENSTLEQLQKRYEVPYLIWANYEGVSLDVEQVSLNYLGALTVQASGLPTSTFQTLLLETLESLPAINLRGVMTADGAWHTHEDVQAGLAGAEAATTLQEYAIVQYGNLFDPSAGRDYLIR